MSSLHQLEISEPSHKNFEMELGDNLDCVKDEIPDKDGHQNTPYTEGPTKLQFTCIYCREKVPIEDIPLKLKCSCHFCKACIVSYVENCLQYDIVHSKITKSKGMKKGISCSICSCEDCIILSEAQSLAPETFKKWQESKDWPLFQTNGFLQCPECNVVIRNWLTNLPPTGVPEEIPFAVRDIERNGDGDWAIGFIPENLNPDNADTSLSLVESSVDRGSVGIKHLYTNIKVPSNSHSDMLTCDDCKKEVALEDCVELSCSCLLCRGCIENHVKINEIETIKMEAYSCPVCSFEDSVSRLVAIFLVPDAFRSMIKCKNCYMVIRKWPANSPLSRDPKLNTMAAPFVRQDRKKMFANYIYCTYCGFEFCGACSAAPYHEGKSCNKCRYCDLPISFTELVEKAEDHSKSITDLHNEFSKAGLDTNWCIKKEDFLTVRQFESSVCMAKLCRKRMSQGCTRKLECGHHCGGISGEKSCLPCLEVCCETNPIWAQYFS